MSSYGCMFGRKMVAGVRVALAGLAGCLVLMFAGCGDDPEPQCEGVDIGSGFCECGTGQDLIIQPVDECSTETMGSFNLLCCQDGARCSCTVMGCQSSGDLCYCNAASSGQSSCTGRPCCNAIGQNAGQCNCGMDCPEDSVEVPECTMAVL